MIGLLSLLLVVGCQSKTNSAEKSTGNGDNAESLDWLEGKWKSDQWDVTYQFSDTEAGWQVVNGEEVIITVGSLTDGEKDGMYTITSSEGTKLYVTKKSDNEIELYQESKSGSLGTTQQVVFEKVED